MTTKKKTRGFLPVPRLTLVLLIKLLFVMLSVAALSNFFFNDTATTEIYTLSLHDALPIWCSLFGALPPRQADLPSSFGPMTACPGWRAHRAQPKCTQHHSTYQISSYDYL